MWAHTKCNILIIGELELIIIFAAYPSCRRSNSYIINMKKLLLLVCIAWTGQCVSVVSAQSSSKSIYKKGWIDFDAGPIVEGESIDNAAKRLLQLVIEVANGKETQTEKRGYRSISIFKDGVVL